MATWQQVYLKSEIEQSCFLGKLNRRIPTTYNKFGIESALCHILFTFFTFTFRLFKDDS